MGIMRIANPTRIMTMDDAMKGANVLIFSSTPDRYHQERMGEVNGCEKHFLCMC